MDAEQSTTAFVMAHNGNIEQLADAICAMNQRNSPLLRLPRELRDQIYVYAIGGRLIYSRYSEEAKAHLHKSTLELGTLDDRRPNFGVAPSQFLGLLFTCRQIYAEARLLPFQLSTFMINALDLKQFLGSLNIMQRQSITTFRIHREFLRDPVFWRHVIPYLSEDSAAEQSTGMRLRVEIGRCIGFEELATISGLKSVIVDTMSLRGKGKHYQALHKERLVTAICKATGERGVEIIFEDVSD